MTVWSGNTLPTPSGVSIIDEDSWAPGWVDHSGRIRALRAELERFQPEVSLRSVAAAARFDFAQLSRLEQGKSAWTLPTFARVAGGLLGTLSW
ncbi:MAG: helix-turn-helix transcriptional regulator [Oscillochloris sp.]|nr:helix-turn-helix transcriptional regulator [Oscillochloris sp.]